jgi:predicted metalloprotease
MNIRKTLAAITLTGSLAASAMLATTTLGADAASNAGRTRSHETAGPRSGHESTSTAGPDHGTATDPGTNTPVDRAVSRSSAAGTVNTALMHRPGEAVAGTDTGSWSNMADFMTFVVQDAASVWNWYYQQWGYTQTSSVNWYFSAPGEVVKSACNGGALTDTSSPFYCPADDTIYFAQVRAQWYWENAGGDFGVAAALAHEYGHNVQNELNIQRATYGPAKFEQHADCFSGAFAHVAYYQGILDANDITEGRASRFLVGDDDVDNPDHHGTSQERMAAFQLGYDAAGPAGCDVVLTG